MKKYLAMFLALVMVFALVACGGKTNPTPTPTPEPEDNTPDAAELVSPGRLVRVRHPDRPDQVRNRLCQAYRTDAQG